MTLFFPGVLASNPSEESFAIEGKKGKKRGGKRKGGKECVNVSVELKEEREERGEEKWRKRGGKSVNMCV